MEGFELTGPREPLSPGPRSPAEQGRLLRANPAGSTVQVARPGSWLRRSTDGSFEGWVRSVTVRRASGPYAVAWDSALSRQDPSERQLEFRHVPLVHVVMADQLVRPGELLLTAGPPTAEGLLTCFTCMSPGVGLQVVGAGEFALTSFTLEWFHTCVSPLVSFELV